MQVTIMLSNRHVHLTQKAVDILFGEEGITLKKYLAGNSGPFACNETVVIEGPKGRLENVRVVGPCRKYVQAELLKSDCFAIGVKAPVRNAGDLENACELKLVGPKGSIVENCGIIAKRHIHVPDAIAMENGYKQHQIVSVLTEGERSIQYNNVEIHIGGPDFSMHIDMEEGNCAGLKNGDLGEIITLDK